MASSRVGTRTSACGARPPICSRSSTGSAKAAVLPVPVAAWPTTSRPDSTAGIAARWIGVGSSYPSSSNACCSSARSPSSAKTVVTASLFHVDGRSRSGGWCAPACAPRRSRFAPRNRANRHAQPLSAGQGGRRRGARRERGRRDPPSAIRLQVPAELLLALDGLEQGLKVALAEAQRAVPLDEFEEHGGPVADGLGEDLQQVAVLVAVDQDVPALELLDRHADLADAGAQLRVVVVRVRRREELHATGAHLVGGAQDVVGGQRDVLAA